MARNVDDGEETPEEVEKTTKADKAKKAEQPEGSNTVKEAPKDTEDKKEKKSKAAKESDRPSEKKQAEKGAAEIAKPEEAKKSQTIKDLAQDKELGQAKEAKAEVAKTQKIKTSQTKPASNSKRRSNNKKRKELPLFGWIAIALACLGVGILVGHFIVPSTLSSSALSGTTTVTEDHLDDVMGTYTYNGTTHNVTVEDVIEESSTLDDAKNDDGTYTLPAVDGVLSVARNQIVLDEADSRGDTATDDEAAAFAEEQLGTSDYSTIASDYSLDEDTAETMIKDAATMSKLRDEVVTTEVPDAPTAPTAPDDGSTDTASQDYATYIIDLAGDEWDSANNTWADSSSDYATALADYTVTNDSATYGAAEAAYYVAYEKYSEASSSASSEWYSFCNSLFENATITMNTLVTSTS